MTDHEFPPNSDKAKLGEGEEIREKKVEQVTAAPARRRKRGLGKQFKSVFFGGDAKTALQYGIYEVVVPGIKEMIVDFGRDTLERLVMGQSRRQRNAPTSGPGGYVSYQNYARHPMGSQTSRTMSRAARVRHNFDEIVLESRQEAEDVLDRLFELVDRFGSASVADLYELVGVRATHADQKWGWEDLRGSTPTRIRGGYLVDLPEPEPLN